MSRKTVRGHRPNPRTRALTRLALAGGVVLLVAAFAATAVTASAAESDEATAAATSAAAIDPIAAATASRLAVAVCGTCHGRYGNSQLPKFPRLAAQNGNYLATQLKAFRAQTRGDADAIGYMWGMASSLDDSTIEALAAYYARQPAAAGISRNAGDIRRGADIYLHGIEKLGVPACAACHGPDGHGIADFPRLAGQHAQYVLKQLASFRSNMRNVAVMHGVAQDLGAADMAAVAAYIESLN